MTQEVSTGARVYLRADWPRPWTETDDLVDLNGVPCEYEVTALVPRHEAEVTGGTATIGTQVTIAPVTPASGPEMTVPLDRVVIAGSRSHP